MSFKHVVFLLALLGCGGGGAAEPVCGNGFQDPGETCDPPGPSCSETCQSLRLCGDGVLDATEECDDGNIVDGDGCSITCTVETSPEPEPAVQELMGAPAAPVIAVPNGADADGSEMFVMTGNTIHLVDRTPDGLTSVGSVAMPAGTEITSAVPTATGALVGGFVGTSTPTAILFDVDGTGAPAVTSQLAIGSGGGNGEQILALAELASDRYAVALARWLNAPGDRREPDFVFLDRDGADALRLDPARGGLRVRLDNLANAALAVTGTDLHFIGFAFDPVLQVSGPFHLQIANDNTLAAVQVGPATQQFRGIAAMGQSFVITGDSTVANQTSMFLFDGTSAVLVSDPGADVTGADVAITANGPVAIGNVGAAFVTVDPGSLASPQPTALAIGDGLAEDVSTAIDLIVATSSTATGIQVATLDGDGKIDVATCTAAMPVNTLVATSTAAPATTTLDTMAFTPTATSSPVTTTAATLTFSGPVCR